MRNISQQILIGKSPDMNWLIDLAGRRGLVNRIKLFDYHIEDAYCFKVSSIHAKMFIADHSMAHIRSEELRRNSISNNFEVETLICEPSACGIIELFDLIASNSRRSL